MVLRAMRPDRLTTALPLWINRILPFGNEYTECDSKFSPTEVANDCFKDTNNAIPLFFILTPGTDPVEIVKDLGKEYGYSIDEGNLKFVSMGEGMDVVATDMMENAVKEGQWVMLSNIHLMIDWLKELEKLLDKYKLEMTHANFRVFLSAEPSNGIPVGILERCIKITNEPPMGMKANLGKAMNLFGKDKVDSKEPKEKCI